MTTESPFETRLHRCQDALSDDETLVLFPSPNLLYLTGFEEEPAERHLLAFVTPGDFAIVAPEMYADQIIEETYIERVDAWADGDDPMAVVEDVLSRLGVEGGRVLLDDRMFALFSLDLQAALPNAEFGLASAVLDDLRIRKDEGELDALREAGRISDEASEAIRAMGAEAVGMTEAELAAEIGAEMEARGGDGFSFDPIVGSGPKGAQPHYRHGDREIRAGEPVILDFGTRYDGYPGDQTRTVVFDGEPPEEFERIHAVVHDALDAAVEAVEPGVTAASVDEAARSVIEEAGYGEQFLHRTGHGLGLEVHEAPYIVEGNETVLEPGMVHSIEPGIYLDGRFGARIEDIVVVTEDGCERLNHSPRTWEPL
ncbi:M24 family metallopeptidase [Halovivax gelatinilyticus]|uniref:M24 family metallopeptidase n=1 Tax=Halovivax gelatinilyticus TaxID=2961597 RepID=UPI0020CA5576|nr:Xaa-Pro peptidase family protein [Halovivax gelatinilyticus]